MDIKNMNTLSTNRVYGMDNYNEYKINIAAIKSIDDIIEIFKALDIRIGFYDYSQTKSLQETIVKNNPHLFNKVKRWIQKN